MDDDLKHTDKAHSNTLGHRQRLADKIDEEEDAHSLRNRPRLLDLSKVAWPHGIPEPSK